ncbi:hypothetical protein GCM10011512_26820 [Tersicoccus solisilvae]|uniref:Uncharacterized protein n=1 Tax=Tersicoccus solisilvae TaxID=1882339 RepID=A0ABQ1PK70_9MICC|nr:hypothetical protein [Tersicoccus solisilvae]GGC98516.1 hypothetical protein GCM10011512_26820 [Tersicoccus solisilvae]
MSALNTAALMTVRPAEPRTRLSLLARLRRPMPMSASAARRERYLQDVQDFRTTHRGDVLVTGGSAWPEFD